MQLFCQSCHAAYTGMASCPKCGSRLLSPQESFLFSGPAMTPAEKNRHQSTTKRVAVGAVVALGFYIGFREVSLALGILGVGGATDGGIDFALRLLSIIAGAILSGAGREQGFPTGLGVGAVAGGLLLIADTYIAGGPAMIGWVAPAAMGVIALLAGPCGAVGALIWPPETEIPSIAQPKTASSRGSSLSRLVEETADRDRTRPTLWLRVFVGAAIASAGLLLSEDIREWLSRGSGGLIQTGGAQRGPIIGFQVAIFLLWLGGLISAASTGAGARHGLLVGLFTAMAVYFASATRPDESFAPISGYYLTFSRGVESIVTNKQAALEIVSMIVGLTTFGGWLGGQLFPPLAPRVHRLRRLSAHS